MAQFAQSTGWGALFLIFYLENIARKINYFKIFFIFIVIFSFFEYVVGFMLDALFAENWWDYSDSKYNINGRITLLNSFLWGVITVLFIKLIYPLIQKFKTKVIDRIPNNAQIFIAIGLVSINSIDTVLSCIKYLK